MLNDNDKIIQRVISNMRMGAPVGTVLGGHQRYACGHHSSPSTGCQLLVAADNGCSIELHQLSVIQRNPGALCIELGIHIGVLSNFAVARLLEPSELGARSSNNTLCGHRGMAPESLDRAFIAVGGYIHVGVGPRLIVTELDTHGLDVRRTSKDGRGGGHKAQSQWNEPHFESSGWTAKFKIY